MEEAELQEVYTYVSRHQNKIAQFIATRPIMDLCLAEERRPGSRVSNRWWCFDQSSSLSNRGLGRQATQIMLEYDLAAMIAI